AAQTEREGDDADDRGEETERDAGVAEHPLHDDDGRDEVGGRYSDPCLIMIRSESNVSPRQRPSHTTGRPSAKSSGGSPWWKTEAVTPPSVTLNTTPWLRRSTVQGTTDPAMRSRPSPWWGRS